MTDDPEQTASDQDTWECVLVAFAVFVPLLIWVSVARLWNKVKKL